MSQTAEYLLVLRIKEGMAAPSIEAIGGAMEVGTEDAPEDMGFDAIEQIVVKEPRRGFTLDEREFASVLAALRYWQRLGITGPTEEDEIATNGGTLHELSGDEIDALCDRLNTEPVNAEPRFMLVWHGDETKGSSQGEFYSLSEMLAANSEAEPEYCEWLRTATVGQHYDCGGGGFARSTTWRIS